MRPYRLRPQKLSVSTILGGATDKIPPSSSSRSRQTASSKTDGSANGYNNTSMTKRKNKQEDKTVNNKVTIPEYSTIQQLSLVLSCPIAKVEAILTELGEAPKSDQDIVSPDYAELVALELGFHSIEVGRSEASASMAELIPRPPVVTVMGHVDHGKTTLLDALRETSVAAGEAGGITQHIGAFEIKMPDSQASLTFLDTPGHAAFSAMRARGAAVTDIIVLVVAADDGVMAQTREAIAHARDARCPVVVAITKCDKPSADVARVRQQLMAESLELEDIGGTVQVVEVSAVARTKLGMDKLEEALLLQSELMELKSPIDCPAEGAVIEAKLERGQGPVATFIVTRGTLKVGDVVVVGNQWGKVRSMRPASGAALKTVSPGQPAEVSGLKGLPLAGDEFRVVKSEDRAQRLAKARSARSETARLQNQPQFVGPTPQEQMELLYPLSKHIINKGTSRDKDGKAGIAAAAAADLKSHQKVIPIVLKADVQGSLEAVRDAIQALADEICSDESIMKPITTDDNDTGANTTEVKLSIIQTGVGPVTAADVEFAATARAIIVGFGVKGAPGSDKIAKHEGVEVVSHRVIYHLLQYIEDMLLDAAPKIRVETVMGEAEVLKVFAVDKKGLKGSAVAGCRVVDGSMKGPGSVVRVVRKGEVVFTGPCVSLKKEKQVVDVVTKGTECGIVLQGWGDVKEGDMLQHIGVEMKRPQRKK